MGDCNPDLFVLRDYVLPWRISAYPPPAPVITGIADSTTWSNTIYQGATGYLAIFGTTLTAWGQTPSPTVTGDGSVVIGSVIYASDGQVNVGYTVAANAAVGQHTISLATPKGTARGTVGVSLPPSLYCPALVTRGSSATCTISGAPANAVSSWTFSAGSTLVQGPAGALSWSGTIVATGNVSATVGGVVLTPQQILVIPRSGWHTQPSSATLLAGDTVTSPTNNVTLPVPPAPNGMEAGLGAFGWSVAYGGIQYITLPQGGLNGGFTYISAAPSYPASTNFANYVINTDLQNPSSTFSQYQCGSGGFISWSNLLAQTNRHEWNSPTQSHYGEYTTALNANNPGDLFEPSIATPGSNLTQFIDGLVNSENNLLSNVAAATAIEPYPVNDDQNGNFLGNINYGPNYVSCN